MTVSYMSCIVRLDLMLSYFPESPVTPVKLLVEGTRQGSRKEDRKNYDDWISGSQQLPPLDFPLVTKKTVAQILSLILY